MSDESPGRERQGPPAVSTAEPAGPSRRDVLRSGGLLAAAGLGGSLVGAAGCGPSSVALEPKMFPQAGFVPDIDVAGQFAVVTGASRGIGRAIGEALHALGVTVVGTSRNAATAPYPTSFPLLDLDIADAASTEAFVDALTSHPSYPGRVSILINNAGRLALGTTVPPDVAADPIGYYLEQSDLGMATLHGGHVRLTQLVLPLMAGLAYARVLFTTSIVAYNVGGASAAGQDFNAVYVAGKRALLGFANTLRGHLTATGSVVKVSTVNPYGVNTDLAKGTRPLFLEPVNADGDVPWNPPLQQRLDGIRLSLANALDPAVVGQAYAQLVQMADPPPNVVASTPGAPGNGLIERSLLDENEQAAVTFVAPETPTP